MAGKYYRTTAHPNVRRVNSSGTERSRERRVYVDGNTVRVLDDYEEEIPVRRKQKRPLTRKEQRRREKERREILERAERSRKRRVKKTRVEQKRARALARSMSPGYVLVLASVCVITLFLCIHYLQLRSEVINQSETIAVMESSLNRMKADNDAFENQLEASVNMADIKDTALNRFGLHYASESQIRYYNADNESYVRQYRPVPGD